MNPDCKVENGKARTLLAVDFEDVDCAIDMSQLLHRLLKSKVRVAFGATHVRVATAQTPVVKEDLPVLCIVAPSVVPGHVEDVNLTRPRPQQIHQSVLEAVVAVGPD